MRIRSMTAPAARRSAFSTIELMIVVSIILVLMSLTAVAVFRLVGWSRARTTEQTMTKVHDNLNRHFERLRNEADKLPLCDAALLLADDGTGEVGRIKERARVIQFKMLLKYYFPMSYQEAQRHVAESMVLTDPNRGMKLYPDGHPVAKAIWKKIEGHLALTGANPPPVLAAPATPEQALTQQAACLLAIYEVAGGKSDDLTSQEQGDTDADGVPEVTDAWGNPLVFYRNSLAPDFYKLRAAAAFPAKYADPYDIDDPGRLLLDTTWLAYPNPAFGNTQNQQTFAAWFGHDPSRPFYLPLLIVSAGGNGGPRLPNLGFGDDDDIDTYRLRLSVTGSQ